MGQWTIKRRLAWMMLYEQTGNAGLVCRRCGISRPTLRKWWRRYREAGVAGLASRSRRPHQVRVRKVLAEQRQWIVDLRQERLGVRRIQNELQRVHHFMISLATIHKVLKEAGAPPLQRLKRKQKPVRYQKDTPGERVQLDTLKVGPGRYQYTAIDDCTRYLVVGVYARRSAANTLHFLTERVFEEMPFPIQRLQTDRGREFTAYKVQDFLTECGVKYRPIRPRSPHLNGKVEHVQKTVLDEFYTKLKLGEYGLERLNDELAYWQHYYNWDRRHGTTQLTPMEKLHSQSDKMPFWDEVTAEYDPISEAAYAAQWRATSHPRKVKRCV